MSGDRIGEGPFADAGRMRAALEALGLGRPDLEDKDPAFLIGALLAFAEAAAWNDLDRGELPVAHEGYMSVLLALAGNDLEGAARGWSVVLNDRLNRTALELQEATEGNGRVFVEVAGPAMLVAANLLNVLNHSALTADMVQEMIKTADGNLKTARRNLGHLRDFLTREGFSLA
jgi:hypothetical protein